MNREDVVKILLEVPRSTHNKVIDKQIKGSKKDRLVDIYLELIIKALK